MLLKPKYRELFNEYFMVTEVQYGDTLHRKLDILFLLIKHQILDNPKSYEETDEKN